MTAESPHLVHVHCVAHRLALAATDASKHVKEISLFRETLNGIYRFFANSAARHTRLLELHKALDPSDFKSLKEPCSVRWLSLSKAVESVFENWHTLILSLGEEAAHGNSVLDGLLRQIKCYKFIAIMHMMKDVLPVMDRLSKSFQVENIALATVKPRVTGAKLQLAALRDKLGEAEEQFGQEFSRGRSYKGQTLTYSNQTNIDAYKDIRIAFLQDLISNLENQFPENDLDVLSAFATVFEVKKISTAGQGNSGVRNTSSWSSCRPLRTFVSTR